MSERARSAAQRIVRDIRARMRSLMTLLPVETEYDVLDAFIGEIGSEVDTWQKRFDEIESDSDELCSDCDDTVADCMCAIEDVAYTMSDVMSMQNPVFGLDEEESSDVETLVDYTDGPLEEEIPSPLDMMPEVEVEQADTPLPEEMSWPETIEVTPVLDIDAPIDALVTPEILESVSEAASGLFESVAEVASSAFESVSEVVSSACESVAESVSYD